MVDIFNVGLQIVCNPYDDILKSDLCNELMNDKELNEYGEFDFAYNDLLAGNSSDYVFNTYFEGQTSLVGCTRETLLNNIQSVFIAKRTEKLRDLLEQCTEAGDVNGVVEATQAILDVSKSFNTVESFSTIDYARDGLKEDVKQKESDPNYLVHTGFKEIDYALGGGFMRKGELFGILAQSNVGKSWMLHSICNNLSRDGETVGLYSPEMPAERVVERFATLQSHISNSAITKGREVDYELLDKACRQLSSRDTDILIKENKQFGGKNPTVTQLRQWCESEKLTVLAIDGISYVLGRGRTEWKQQSNVAQELMDLSEELSIPVIFVVQASRTKKGEDFDGNSSTAGSKDIYNKSTISFKLTSTYTEDKMTELLVNIDKSRYGTKGGDIRYNWKIDTGDFINVDSNTPSADTINQATKKPKRERVEDAF